MIWMTGQSAPSASLLMTQNCGEWLMFQRVVLPSRGTSTGWRNGLMGTSCSSTREVQILEPGQYNPMHWYMLGAYLLTNSFTGQTLGSWWTLSWTWASNVPLWQRWQMVSCIRRSVTSRWREAFLPLCSALAGPYLECCVRFWVSHTDINVINITNNYFSIPLAIWLSEHACSPGNANQSIFWCRSSSDLQTQSLSSQKSNHKHHASWCLPI